MHLSDPADTHAAIWFITDDAALGRRSRAMADQALDEDGLAISAISFWEIALLIAKGRLRALTTPLEQRATILGAGINEIALTGDIAVLAVELENLHGDPADRFIAATIAHDSVLMTADDTLLRWRHRIKRQNAAR